MRRSPTVAGGSEWQRRPSASNPGGGNGKVATRARERRQIEAAWIHPFQACFAGGFMKIVISKVKGGRI